MRCLLQCQIGNNSCWGKRFITRTSYLLEVQVETYKVQSRTLRRETSWIAGTKVHDKGTRVLHLGLGRTANVAFWSRQEQGFLVRDLLDKARCL